MDERWKQTFASSTNANGVLFISTVDAAAPCAEICYTTELTGFGTGGVPGCTCSGPGAGARTGEGECLCGQCYVQTQNTVYGFAISLDGNCLYGTDCGSCDVTSTSPTSTPSPPLPVPSTPSPVPSLPQASQPSITPGSSVANVTSTRSSPNTDITSRSADTSRSTSSDKAGNTTDNHAGGNAATSQTLGIWQIVLTLCSSLLFFLVLVISICSCYYKTRSRLNKQEEDHASYFYQQLHLFQPRSMTHANTERRATIYVRRVEVLGSKGPAAETKSISISSAVNE
ncbi:hypothetical protein PsorP6_001790 [Peronosclerospora sorghi]|uniref:Uncharacterized protein n=1 Tax=Peronosclerospora sorghi TaxID=230839 RepID=A0ACC0WTP4_9STRA|nr:hypothetical protein PsorP6_001790 [Peronosclerospora sorghi]